MEKVVYRGNREGSEQGVVNRGGGVLREQEGVRAEYRQCRGQGRSGVWKGLE